MDALAYFSADYQEARAKFRAAARAAGARLTAYENPAVGPGGSNMLSILFCSCVILSGASWSLGYCP